MHRSLCLTAILAIAASLWAPAHARTSGYLAQNTLDASASVEPVVPQANSPAQIRKAQTELKRLDCLKGPIDGHLGPRTRKAVTDYWAMAKQPAPAEVDITDALIAELAERGDNYCRPARPFFSFGGRGGKFLPPFAPGVRAAPGPGTPPKEPTTEMPRESMAPKKPAPGLIGGGYRFPACAKPWYGLCVWFYASAGEGRSEKACPANAGVMLHQ